jgi:hypothetical protein
LPTDEPDYDNIFKGDVVSDDWPKLTQMLLDIGPADWLTQLLHAVHTVLKHEWENWDEAKAAQATVFARPAQAGRAGKARPKEPTMAIGSSPAELRLLKAVLRVDNFIAPRSWRGCFPWDPLALTELQPYLHVPFAPLWEKRQGGFAQLKDVLRRKRKNQEVAWVAGVERIKYRVVEEGLAGGRWQADMLPWAQPTERKEAMQYELLEVPVDGHAWCTELAPMVDHFRGREHLIITTSGGMSSTSHNDGVGGWGYLGEGWKVVVSVNVLQRENAGWTAQEELLHLDLLLSAPSLKWTLLGPGSHVWFTPDSHHAVITLCPSTYVTWSATTTPHRLLLTLGFILNAHVQDCTWTALGGGQSNDSAVYVNIMEMVVHSWLAQLGQEQDRRFTVDALRAYRPLREQLRRLFTDERINYEPLDNEPIGVDGSKKIRALYQLYVDSMQTLEDNISEKDSGE